MPRANTERGEQRLYRLTDASYQVKCASYWVKCDTKTQKRRIGRFFEILMRYRLSRLLSSAYIASPFLSLSTHFGAI